MGWFGFGKKADKAPAPAAPVTDTLDDGKATMLIDAPPSSVQVYRLK